MDDKRQIVCIQCEAINRLSFQRLEVKPICGRCQQPLFQNKTFILNTGNFQRHISQNEIPVLVQFWAQWCGYCQKMAPAYEQAASTLEPFVRLARLNTEADQVIASKYAVSSLPTMVLFRNSKELARQAGALTAEQIIAWTRAKILS